MVGDREGNEVSNTWFPSAALLLLEVIFVYTSVLTLRVLTARHNLLGTEDWFLSVVCEDTYSCFQHAHGGKRITAAT